MSKKHRKLDKQKRMHIKINSRNAKRRVEYVRMAEDGMEGKRERARNKKHYREAARENDYGNQDYKNNYQTRDNGYFGLSTGRDIFDG